jgi:hypothetical protein
MAARFLQYLYSRWETRLATIRATQRATASKWDTIDRARWVKSEYTENKPGSTGFTGKSQSDPREPQDPRLETRNDHEGEPSFR